MEHFILVPASLYKNRNITTQPVTKQELANYQTEQNHTYLFDSLKREINSKWFAKADSSVDKRLFCPGIMLPNKQTLILHRVETGVVLTDFDQQHRRRNADVPVFCFCLHAAAGFLWSSESKCQNQKKSKLGPFQNMNVRSCKNFTHKVVLLMSLFTMW